jgi:fructose-1,6-bisphosphatase I
MFLLPTGMFTFALKQAGAWRFIKDETGKYCRPARLQLPADESGWELSWNSANRHTFAPDVKAWLEQQEPKHAFRYAGALAVDFHRLLGNGGMFAYPAVVNHPDPSKNRADGKLRLLYEANVVAFIANEAGGLAVNEQGDDVLDVLPSSRHQRTALYVGNRGPVSAIQKILKARAR